MKVRFKEMWSDVRTYMSNLYNEHGQVFTPASPFAQILQTILHVGRMVLYYVEDSITELNISTASRPSSIYGLASLTGHSAFRGSASRGRIRLLLKEVPANTASGEVLIPNLMQVYSNVTGVSYIVLIPAEQASIPLRNGAFLDVDLVQGSIEYQQGTSDGGALQSYNFSTKGTAFMDEYLVRVFVNGELYQNRSSLLDMGRDEKSCIVRTGMLGGVDVFFGNGDNGAIPPKGASIMIEYLLANGTMGNLSKTIGSNPQNWTIKTEGLMGREEVDLNKYISVVALTDMTLGEAPEDLALTKVIAPHSSRSMVLANKTNYEYFLRRLNMFSIVDVFRGDNTNEDEAIKREINALQKNIDIHKSYLVDAEQSNSVAKIEEEKEELRKMGVRMRGLQQRLFNTQLDDNTIYLFLVPDIKKRLGAYTYFTAPESMFTLSEDEQQSILDLIEESGQRVITIENKILQPRIAKFAINISVRKWEGSSEEAIRDGIMASLSNYFLEMTRRDRVPQSDIVRLCEDIDGVDSVRVSFVGDPRNNALYSSEDLMTIKDGLDSDGDIVLSRSIETTLGGKIVVRDILPLIKGGFTSSNGFTYTNNAVGDIAKKIYGAVNITFHQGESSSDNKFFRTRSIV